MHGPSTYEGLKREALVCAQCGYCRVECPVYRQIGWESSSPRAKMTLAGKLADRDKLASAEIQRLFQCTLCGRCQADCATRIDTLAVWKEMRKRVAAKNDGPENLQLMVNTIDESGNTTGDPQENRELWLDALDDESIRGKLGRRAKMLYFAGCSSSLYPQIYGIPQAFVQIMESVAEDYTILGAQEACCGFPLIAAGAPEKMKKQMAHNVAIARELGVETVVTTCPSCYHTWRDTYAELSGKTLPFQVLHASQLLEQYIRQGRLQLGEIEEKVTYHDPCDLGRNSGVYDAPRFVLASIPGLEFVEMADHGVGANCCGGGGNLEAVDPNLTAAIASQRLGDAVEIGAKTVVSGCQQCKRTLQVNARKNKVRLRFMDITEIVYKAMQQI